MSSTDSESESGRGGEEEEEEEEEEEAQRSSEAEEGEEEEVEEEGEEGEEEGGEEEGEEAEEEEEEGEGEGEDEEEDEENGEEQEEENGHRSKGGLSRRRKRNSSSGAAEVLGNGKVSKSADLTSLAFPISRVRRLVKSEVDALWVGVEAGFLIAKATELFLEKFVEDAFEKMTEDERTHLSYRDLASHVSSTERYDFLSDFVPEMVPASTALAAKVDK